ncbi:MAG: substrate-binding domain-containing protein [Ignavibacteria bacterium]|nr:substrate-binding domain-containing protein [Ignavibacteria bacterium]
MFKNILIIVFLALLSFSCERERKETATSGNIIVLASETIGPIATQLGQKFTDLYPDSKIDVRITSARDAIVQLLNDSVEVIIVSRPLNEEERTVARNYDINLREYKIAEGGFVLIVNQKNSLSGLRVSQIDSICKGKIKYWDELGVKNIPQAIRIYIPEMNSDTYEYFLRKFTDGKALPNHFIRVDSTLSVINEVSKFSNALGFIGLNYLDSINKNVKYLELSDKTPLTDSLRVSGTFFSPAQYYVYMKYYPLYTPVYIYSNIKAIGLSTGFISFVMSTPGQKIIQNNKLVPATVPVRFIQLNRE